MCENVCQSPQQSRLGSSWIHHRVVLAITKDNIDALPTLFKTYDTSTAFDSCTIWQVARATSAALTFFKPIKVGRDEIEFIDASFGCNNPCEILIEEGQRQFPKRGQMRILSIGTGLGDVVTIKDYRFSIINALKQMATSSRKVAARLNSRFGDDGQYFRFNVDQGLQDITCLIGRRVARYPHTLETTWLKTREASTNSLKISSEEAELAKKSVSQGLMSLSRRGK